MKPAAFLFALCSFGLLFQTTALADTPPAPEPGHYIGKEVSFTLEANGQIRNLKVEGKLIASHAANLEHRRFTFRQRAAPIFVYHGTGTWAFDSGTVCHGTINRDIPSAGYYPTHSYWTAHLQRD